MFLETERLILRPFVPDDLEWMVAMNRDPEVLTYINGGVPMDREKTEARLNHYIEHQNKHGFAVWGVRLKTENTLCGFCGLQYLQDTGEVEVGYRFEKSHWGGGLATEAAAGCLEFGFETVKLDRIVAVVHPGNVASRKVIQKIGLRYEKDGRWYDMDLNYFALNRADYSALKSSRRMPMRD